MSEQVGEYRGWLIQFSEEGFCCTPIPQFDWPDGVDPEEYELAQEADWQSPIDALKKAQQDIDRWWDDRHAEANANPSPADKAP